MICCWTCYGAWVSFLNFPAAVDRLITAASRCCWSSMFPFRTNDEFVDRRRKFVAIDVYFPDIFPAVAVFANEQLISSHKLSRSRIHDLHHEKVNPANAKRFSSKWSDRLKRSLDTEWVFSRQQTREKRFSRVTIQYSQYVAENTCSLLSCDSWNAQSGVWQSEGKVVSRMNRHTCFLPVCLLPFQELLHLLFFSDQKCAHSLRMSTNFSNLRTCFFLWRKRREMSVFLDQKSSNISLVQSV